MKCPSCGGPLKVVRTVQAEPAGKVQEAKCESCGDRVTIVALILCRAKGRGNGAQAVAKKVAEGKVELKHG